MKFIYYLLLLLFISQTCLGQEINLDTRISEARHEAEIGNYDKALSLIQPLLIGFPENEEIKIFAGRVYSWKKEYKKSIDILTPLTDRTNPNPDALLAIINTYFWSEQFDKCILYCDQYLVIEPNSTDVIITKAKCLEKLGRDKEALAIVDKVSVTENSTQAITGLRTLIGRKAKNAMAFSYLNVSTSNPGQSPLHYGYVEYSHKFTKSALVGRANLGYANNDTQMLFEADYYQTFSKRNYLYVNGGVSTGQTIFPVAKAGAEYFFAPRKRFDYSLGFKYMHFETDDVTLLTGQLGYRAGSYTLAYRPFYDTSNELFSHVLSVQTSNEEKESLIRLEFQYGNVPYLYLYNNFVTPLKAYRVGIQYQHRFGGSFFVRPVFLYEYEEYLPDEYRNRFSAQLIITKRF
ncbi:YaiO family outer membrane beta-barrel protein [Flavobacterium sp. JLP]|uniref:YaiO family outer membrane beta-barrel protein n=1 Tax=Flavobacterium sp. JLP TaxID=2783793 RepID=UPI001889CF99|nr:YaiO family outer membrane beta-barrel protein [Flavobacterium sp. JLP]MBF4505298.1 YaiO family outer membrane beta-barrel protein [Flavobacterium sp. JLP]